jgi:hypothetical protein
MDMAEAVKPLNRIPAVAEACTVPDQITLATAGEILSKRFPNSNAAGVRLDIAVRCAEVRLYAGDKPEPVSPNFFAGHLRVVVAVDGRLEIRATRAIVGTHVWTVDREDILKLIEGDASATASRNPRGAGRKPSYDRDFVINAAWAYICENDVPSSLDALSTSLRVEHESKIPELSRCKEILAQAWPMMQASVRRR